MAQKPNLITYAGTTRTLTEWAKVLGVSHGVLESRLRERWPLERALTPGLFLRLDQINAAKTECIRGHAFNMENTQVTKDGKRKCRACARMHREKYRAKTRS